MINSSFVFLTFQGADLGDIDEKTDSFHFESVFLSETSKWVKTLYLTIIIMSFNLKVRPFTVNFRLFNL